MRAYIVDVEILRSVWLQREEMRLCLWLQSRKHKCIMERVRYEK